MTSCYVDLVAKKTAESKQHGAACPPHLAVGSLLFLLGVFFLPGSSCCTCFYRSEEMEKKHKDTLQDEEKTHTILPNKQQ